MMKKEGKYPIRIFNEIKKAQEKYIDKKIIKLNSVWEVRAYFGSLYFFPEFFIMRRDLPSYIL